jgi:hypothetical protein
LYINEAVKIVVTLLQNNHAVVMGADGSMSATSARAL